MDFFNFCWVFQKFPFFFCVSLYNSMQHVILVTLDAFTVLLWIFRLYTTWHIVEWLVPDVLKECSTFIFLGQRVPEESPWPLQMKALFSFETSRTTCWRTHNLFQMTSVLTLLFIQITWQVDVVFCFIVFPVVNWVVFWYLL